MPRSVQTALRNMPLLIMTILLLLINPRIGSAAMESRKDLALTAGYRADTLDWNIAGDNSGQNPDILSELTWRDLRIYQVGLIASVEYVGSDAASTSLLMRGALGLGRIVQGKNQDSDYDGDNRTLEFSRSNNNADAGSVIDLSLASGCKIRLRDNRYTLNPLVGFSYYAQNLTMSDGEQTLSEQAYPLGPIDGLNSTYDAAWYGPWLGVDVIATPNRNWTFSTGIELHQVFFRAEADWNLRSDLAHPKSFEHKGDGFGVIWHLGSSYALTPNLEITVSAELKNFAIRDGTDRTFLPDGREGTTRLNEVNWRSKMFSAGVNYRY